jgi:hypothetical protein
LRLSVNMDVQRSVEHEPIDRAVGEIYQRLGSRELDAERATDRVFELLKEVAFARRGSTVRRTWPRRRRDC